MTTVTVASFKQDQAALDALAGGFAVADAATTVVANIAALNADSHITGLAFTSGSAATADAFSLGSATSLDLGAGTLSLTGSASFAGALITGGPGATLVTNGATSVGGLTLGGAAVWQNLGTVTETASVTIGDASGTKVRLANTTGAIFNLAGDIGLGVGPNTASNFNNNGGTLAKTAGTGVSVIAAGFQDGSGAAAQIVVDSGTLNFTGKTNSFVNQTISGAGTFQIGGGGTSTIGPGTTISTAGWSIAKYMTFVTFGEGLTYNGVFTDTNHTALNIQGYTLTLAGTANFNLGPMGAPFISGNSHVILAGTTNIGALQLSVSGLTNDGTVTQTGTLDFVGGSGHSEISNLSGSTWIVLDGAEVGTGGESELFDNGGTLLKASGTGTSSIGLSFSNDAGTSASIRIDSGTLEFDGAISDFVAQSISGAGTFALASAAWSWIDTGTTITSAAWTVVPVTKIYSQISLPTQVGILEDISYGGSFSTHGNSLLYMFSHTLTLTGSTSFGGSAGDSVTLIGSGDGKLILSGDSTIGTAYVEGSLLFRNNGNISQTGDVYLGKLLDADARLTNAAGHSWTLGADVGINDTGNGVFNSGGGYLAKTAGTGTSVIGVRVINLNDAVSQIEVASGTLDFARTVSGNQAFQIDDGRTLEFDSSVATGSTVTYAGSSGTLVLNDAQDFEGAIKGFGIGKSLDAASIAYAGSSQTLFYNGTTLLVGSGGKTANLAIGAGYTSANFHLASDAHGGSLVTYG